MKESCLHCLLIAAAFKWLKTHNASTEDICAMVGRATGEIISSLPEHHGQEVDVLILGTKHIGGGAARLH